MPVAAEPDGSRIHVLVVDDDPAIRTALHRALDLEGFHVTTSSNGRDATDAILSPDGSPPDVVLLDVTMPDGNGIDVCRAVRSAGNDVPVFIVSARDEVADRVAGLEAGADDYLVKPFAVAEVVARVRALLRRRPNTTSSGLDVGDVAIDPAARRVTRNGRSIDLTRREFDLLDAFARNVDIVLDRYRLLELVWGYDFDVDTNVVDVFVGYLRRKLEVDDMPRVIHTVRGVGYVMRP